MKRNEMERNGTKWNETERKWNETEHNKIFQNVE